MYILPFFMLMETQRCEHNLFLKKGYNSLTQIHLQILQSLVSQAKRLAKGLYVFSIDHENQKVMHANYVSPSLKARGADARTWASKITDIVGGKVHFYVSLCVVLRVHLFVLFFSGWWKGRQCSRCRS